MHERDVERIDVAVVDAAAPAGVIAESEDHKDGAERVEKEVEDHGCGLTIILPGELLVLAGR